MKFVRMVFFGLCKKNKLVHRYDRCMRNEKLMKILLKILFQNIVFRSWCGVFRSWCGVSLAPSQESLVAHKHSLPKKVVMPKPRRKEQKGQTRSSIQEQARSSILSPDSVPLVNILSQLKQVVVGDDDEENERNFKQKINEIPQSESQQISDSMHDDISREGSLQESARNSSIENSQEINQSQYTSQEMMHEQQYPEYESDDQEEGDGEYEEEEEESQYTNSAYTNSAYTNSAELANLVDEYGSFASLQSSNALKVSTNLSCANCKTLQDQLAMTRLKFEGLMTMQHEWEAGKMHRKLALLQEEVDGKEEELDKMRLDMEILGQKLIDEIEKRAEIQHANESVNHELEELTQSLFVSLVENLIDLVILFFRKKPTLWLLMKLESDMVPLKSSSFLQNSSKK